MSTPVVPVVDLSNPAVGRRLGMFIGNGLGNPTSLGAGEVWGLRPCRMPIGRLHRWELLPLAHTPTASRIEGDEVFGVALRFTVSSIPIEAKAHNKRGRDFRVRKAQPPARLPVMGPSWSGAKHAPRPSKSRTQWLPAEHTSGRMSRLHTSARSRGVVASR